jgi:hypothetical protein
MRVESAQRIQSVLLFLGSYTHSNVGVALQSLWQFHNTVGDDGGNTKPRASALCSAD